jgi:hypothetical protein
MTPKANSSLVDSWYHSHTVGRSSHWQGTEELQQTAYVTCTICAAAGEQAGKWSAGQKHRKQGHDVMNHQYSCVFVGCHLRRKVVGFAMSHEALNPRFESGQGTRCPCIRSCSASVLPSRSGTDVECPARVSSGIYEEAFNSISVKEVDVRTRSRKFLYPQLYPQIFLRSS